MPVLDGGGGWWVFTRVKTVITLESTGNITGVQWEKAPPKVNGSKGILIAAQAWGGPE